MRRRGQAEGAQGAVLTCRVSHYDPRRRMRSVPQQEAELRDWCQDEGWAVVATIAEHGVSASKFGKPRRAWLAEVEAELARPDVDRMLTWECSRATRDIEVSEALIALCIKHGVLFGYGDQLYDLTKARDLRQVRHDFVDAAYEAHRTSERVSRDMRHNAAAGGSHGRRLYGYRRVYDERSGELVGQVPEPAEEAVVVRIFTEFAEGATLHGIVAGLNRDNVPMPATATKGRTRTSWYDMRVRKILTNRAYLGQRVHHGEVANATAWPAIVGPELWAGVEGRLADRAAVASSHSRAAKHLLSGIARCGRCGGPMHLAKDPTGYEVLKCTEGKGHLVRAYRPVEAQVLRTVIERLEGEDVELAERPDDPETVAARAEVAELQAELEGATERFTANPTRPGAALAYEQIVGSLSAAIEAAQRRVRPARRLPKVVFDLVGPGARARWDALERAGRIADQRDVVRALVTITVLPGVQGRHGYDPDTVKVEPV